MAPERTHSRVLGWVLVIAILVALAIVLGLVLIEPGGTGAPGP